jgi:hypothetical protein
VSSGFFEEAELDPSQFWLHQTSPEILCSDNYHLYNIWAGLDKIMASQ